MVTPPWPTPRSDFYRATAAYGRDGRAFRAASCRPRPRQRGDDIPRRVEHEPDVIVSEPRMARIGATGAERRDEHAVVDLVDRVLVHERIDDLAGLIGISRQQSLIILHLRFERGLVAHDD